MSDRFPFSSPSGDDSVPNDENSSLLSDLISACITVQRRLGPGCPDTVYLGSLVRELKELGIFATKTTQVRRGISPSSSSSSVHSRTRGLRSLSASPFDLVIESVLGLELADTSEAAFRRDPSRRLDEFSRRLEQHGLDAGLLVDFDQAEPSDGLWLVRAGSNRSDLAAGKN